jgi:hypothetical protein
VVGKKVRQIIKELEGAMPEDLTTEDSVKKMKNSQKKWNNNDSSKQKK